MIICQHCVLPCVGTSRFPEVLREKKSKGHIYRGVYSICPEFIRYSREMIGEHEMCVEWR